MEAWVSGGLLQGRGGGGGAKFGSTCMGPFEGGHHYLLYLKHSLVSGQQQRGNTAPAINRKLDERFTEHGPAHQNMTQCLP